MSLRLVRSAGLIGLATMASRVLGLVRDVVLAGAFGAGDRMDAFYVAFRIPNLVRDLFAEGAMTAAFVPTFTRYLTRHGREQAWRLGNTVITALLLVSGALVVVGVVASEPLVRLFAAGFAEVPGKLELTVRLTRVMFPFLTLVAIAVAFMGMLNALRHFFVPALSPAIFNIAVIISVIVLVPVAANLGIDPMLAVGVGVLLGGLGQILLQWLPLRREGFRLRWLPAIRDPGLREILLLMLPGTIGLAAVQVNVFVNTVLAAGEGTGAVSWLSYAFRLMYLPIGVFGVSIATAALPEVSRRVAEDDGAGVRQTVSSGLRLMLMLNVPATLGLVVLAEPIVALIFERGAFTGADTVAVASALMFYAPGLVGYSAVKLASPTFYALGDARTPVMISILSVLVNVVLNVTLVGVMGYRGLALGTAVASVLNGTLLLALLRTRLGGLDGRRVMLAFVKIFVASTVMALTAWWTEGALAEAVVGDDTLPRALRVGTAIGAGLLSLAAMARLLALEEFDAAVAQVLMRLRPR